MTNTRPAVWLRLDQRGTIREVRIVAGLGTGVDELDDLIEAYFSNAYYNGKGTSPRVPTRPCRSGTVWLRLE